jgi:hypothetical protein
MSGLVFFARKQEIKVLSERSPRTHRGLIIEGYVYLLLSPMIQNPLKKIVIAGQVFYAKSIVFICRIAGIGIAIGKPL